MRRAKASGGRRRRGGSRSAGRSGRYAGWLPPERAGERDRRLPLLRADLRSRNDELAERAVEAGGGLEAVIEATGLRTRENVLRAIDPTILVRAFDNAAAGAAGPVDRARLRRLAARSRARASTGDGRAAAAARLRLRRGPHDPGPLVRAAGGCQTAI